MIHGYYSHKISILLPKVVPLSLVREASVWSLCWLCEESSGK